MPNLHDQAASAATGSSVTAEAATGPAVEEIGGSSATGSKGMHNLEDQAVNTGVSAATANPTATGTNAATGSSAAMAGAATGPTVEEIGASSATGSKGVHNLENQAANTGVSATTTIPAATGTNAATGSAATGPTVEEVGGSSATGLSIPQAEEKAATAIDNQVIATPVPVTKEKYRHEESGKVDNFEVTKTNHLTGASPVVRLV